MCFRAPQQPLRLVTKKGTAEADNFVSSASLGERTMKVFDNAAAWFSENVADKYRSLWLTHGGTIKDPEEATYYFSKSEDAEDVRSIVEQTSGRELLLLHPRYILTCVLRGSTAAVSCQSYRLKRKREHAFDKQLESVGPSSKKETPSPPGKLCITDMDFKLFSAHFKPGVPAEVRARILKSTKRKH